MSDEEQGGPLDPSGEATEEVVVDPGDAGAAETAPPESETEELLDQTVPELDDLLVRIPDVIGELVLHFASRDVTLAVDGRAAATALDLFARRKHTGPEAFERGASDMRNAWFATDLDEAIALSWWPGVPRRPARTIIDPVPTVRG